MNIYWLIALLPTWIITTLLVVGVIGFLAATFIGKIPFIKQYNLPIKMIAGVLIVCGVYLQGALAYKQSTDRAVAELRVKLAQAEAKSATVNTEIVERVVTDTQVIREKGRTITEYVDREVVKYNDQCPVPSEVINAHNMAATLNANPAPEGEQQ